LGNKKIDQLTMIALTIAAQLKVSAKCCTLLHVLVNNQPSICVSFIEDAAFVCEEKLLRTNGKSLFDTMPACWTNSPTKQRQDVLSVDNCVCQVTKMMTNGLSDQVTVGVSSSKMF